MVASEARLWSESKRRLRFPDTVHHWLNNTFGEYSVIADTSWPRPNSQVWRIQLPEKPAFLKISATDDSFERERNALESIVPASGIKAPRLLAAETRTRALLLSEVPGLIVRTIKTTPPVIVERHIHQQAGAAIAALHRESGGLARLGDSKKRLDELLELSAKREHTSRSVLSVSQLDAVTRSRIALTAHAFSGRFSAIHGDFQTRNWLWTEDTQSVALIDFESFTVGYSLEDFAWLFATTWLPRPDLRTAFLNGYGVPIRSDEEIFLAAYTVLGSLEHVADGVRLGIPEKIQNGLLALTVADNRLPR